MDLILFAIDFILHVDVHLKELFEHYGVWVYAILFLIIFCETGLVVTLRNGDGPIVAMRGDIDALPITPGGAGRFRFACAGAVRQATASSAFSWYSSIWSKFMYR